MTRRQDINVRLKTMRHLQIVLLPILLIGCDDPERQVSGGQAVREVSGGQAVREVSGGQAVREASGGQAEWKARELQRKERVQALIGLLAEESLEGRQAAYAELRDTFVRRRDMPELIKEIDRNPSPEVKRSLQDLISLMKSESRLPTGGWTRKDTKKAYEREFQDLGCSAVLGYEMGYPTIAIGLALDLFHFPSEAKKQADVVGLILDLEPTGLTLHFEEWTDISFLGALPDIKGLALFLTSVADLTPLRGLNRLSLLDLVGSPVSDLTPLKGLPSLRELKLYDTAVTDLAPLNGLKSLTKLHLEDTKVSDLTPLKGLPNLRSLHLRHTEVTDLTPLKGMPFLEDIEVIDPPPLNGADQTRAEQAGAGQPATRPESDFEGSDKPQPESEGRSR